MAKVHPGTPVPSYASSAPACSFSIEERETYTVWMKSLVLNGNGFTVYDSHGNLVYRIDNYNSKCSKQVFLMDFQGQVLCTLLKKKLRFHQRWDGFKGERVISKGKPWFRVKKISKIFKRPKLSCQVRILEGQDIFQVSSCYQIVGTVEKSEFQIIRDDGFIVAEVKRKQGTKGVMLGSDVLSLEVEPHVDHSLIMALVVVHGFISHKI